MPLLDLPLEILTAVFYEVEWLDFEPFALSCKSLSSTVIPLVAEHNRVRQRYHTTPANRRHLLEDITLIPYMPQSLHI